MRVLKLVNNIDLALDSMDNEYNLTKVFIDPNNSEVLKFKEDESRFISINFDISSTNIQYKKALQASIKQI